MGEDDGAVAHEVALGDVEIDPATLESAGRGLAVVVEEAVGSEPVRWVLTQAQALAVPALGWRTVLSRPTRVLPIGAGYAVHAEVRLAAPHPGEDGAWVLARVQAQVEGGWAVWLDDEAHRPGPSRATRRKGLRLQWPDSAVEVVAGTVPELTVQLVNTTDQPWLASGHDQSTVHARVQRTGTENQPNYGWHAYTPLETVTNLEPGEQVTLPVTFSGRAVRALEPGTYEVTGELNSLGLTTTPRPLHVR